MRKARETVPFCVGGGVQAGKVWPQKNAESAEGEVAWVGWCSAGTFSVNRRGAVRQRTLRRQRRSWMPTSYIPLVCHLRLFAAINHRQSTPPHPKLTPHLPTPRWLLLLRPLRSFAAIPPSSTTPDSAPAVRGRVCWGWRRRGTWGLAGDRGGSASACTSTSTLRGVYGFAAQICPTRPGSGRRCW
jgi:hypothetical protein